MAHRGMAARIGRRFVAIRNEGRIGLFCYLTVGYPSVAATVEAALALGALGVDAIELGMPFSDPIADGPTIQAAAAAALAAGVTTETSLEVAAAVRRELPEVPLLFMGYYNPMLQYGPSRFVLAARDAGVDGFIVPDLSLEEAEEFDGPCRDAGLGIVPLVAPATAPERVRLLEGRGAAFLYVTTRMGVTGASGAMTADAPRLVRRVRAVARAPVGVGFGISKPQHVAALRGLADAAIVGSALVSAMGSAAEPARAAAELAAPLVGAARGTVDAF